MRALILFVVLASGCAGCGQEPAVSIDTGPYRYVSVEIERGPRPDYDETYQVLAPECDGGPCRPDAGAGH